MCRTTTFADFSLKCPCEYKQFFCHIANKTKFLRKVVAVGGEDGGFAKKVNVGPSQALVVCAKSLAFFSQRTSLSLSSSSDSSNISPHNHHAEYLCLFSGMISV